jgi:3-hydroxy-9,10-secoandrosta-1,3,5(10)-triene-9,17-dione monooxygenase reductase component
MSNQVSPDSLRAVMRRVPATVAVLTASANGRRRGMTVGSFTSVSLDPVLVSFNVGKNSSMHEIVVDADTMVIHLLKEDQAHYSEHFAAPDLETDEQFDGIDYSLLDDGTPILNDTLAYIRCRKTAEYEAGDHNLIVAEVLEIVYQSEGEPLLYYNTHYRTVGRIRDALPGS